MNAGRAKKANLAVFVSGRGSNLDSIISSCADGELEPLARVALVVASKSSAAALEIAESSGIDRFIYSKDIPLENLLAALADRDVSFIVLAGYVKKIEDEILQNFSGNILNIHPALLPKFGGKGMYGKKVHQAVIESGEKVSGATVHYVSEVYDAGKILDQETVSIDADETVDSLAVKVLQIEHELYPRSIAIALRSL